MFKKRAAEKLVEMLNDAKKDGAKIIVVSGFRRAEIQRFLYNAYLDKFRRKALDIIAPPGHSEHQLGTVVDLDSENLRSGLENNFEKSPEGK